MKSVALACIGGGIKACINIGVIRALEDLGIKIEAISGSSLGSVIAVLYACGYDTNEIIKIFENDIFKLQKFSLLNKICSVPNLFIKGGAVNPKKLLYYMKKFERDNNIHLMNEIKIPLIIPALDLSSREIVYYTSKPLKSDITQYCDRNISEAVRSSSALPLLFTPYKVVIDNVNHFMLDGGILTNTLVLPLKEFSNFIIGTSVKFYPKQRSRINLFTGFTQTFQSMRRQYLCNERKNSDLWIEIDLGSNRFIGKKEEIKQYAELGYKETIKKLKSFSESEGNLYV